MQKAPRGPENPNPKAWRGEAEHKIKENEYGRGTDVKRRPYQGRGKSGNTRLSKPSRTAQHNTTGSPFKKKMKASPGGTRTCKRPLGAQKIRIDGRSLVIRRIIQAHRSAGGSKGDFSPFVFNHAPNFPSIPFKSLFPSGLL